MKLQAVFLDRDGTIGGSDQVEYPGEMVLYPYTLNAIKVLKDSGIAVYSFTNQPGIANGVVQAIDFEAELTPYGFDGNYICPHKHDEGCKCRKPSAGMLIQASVEKNLDLRRCAVIGDRWTDLMAANEVGAIKIIVKTGAGEAAISKYIKNEYHGSWSTVTPDYIAEDLSAAVNWLLNLRGEI